ncbi:hypothetical protein [Halostella litorea]|uniref:hypothetical protein n=1 Tax=Halostella litorea TaxID=2528831 RepID=UPI00192A648F|nr:hypothetical protein [Halostella litorea]
MTDYNTAEGESSVTDERTELEKRDVRALTEYMTVLPQGGDIYEVVSESGNSYSVDGIEGRCTCPDKQYNLEDGEMCKHERRVRFATGQWAVPAWTDPDAIDPQLGDQVTGTPRIAATDGGVIEAGEDCEVLRDTEDSDKGRERPDDCDCANWNDGVELPCWPCYRDGFEVPMRKATDAK